jgi:hypothetical protein
VGVVRSALLLALLVVGCSFGNADWRRASYNVTVDMPHSDSDHRCSDPAPWTSFRSCVLHDLAYSQARRERCHGADDPRYTSEAARFAADMTMAQQMALDGYGEVWTMAYLYGVRLGGWWTWHFQTCR